MKVLLIEPFYTGSHKQWADQFKKHSTHQITLLTLEGKFWKWRMYGSAITLAKQFNETDNKYDLILTTDMLDVSTFISLVRKKLEKTPVITYFHENQFAYPWQEESEDKKKKRDVHYGMINYQSALSSDSNLFNSEYNMKSFFEGIYKVNQSMPDNKHDKIIDELKRKCHVLPLGMELSSLDIKEDILINKVPIILWNHRLDHDKNPEEFFSCLLRIKKEKIPFKLLILGEQTTKQKKTYSSYIEKLHSNIIYMGYCSTTEYRKFLHMADILPVTSIHDFFGISTAEAMYTGVIPLLPKRLSYIKMYNPEKNSEIFYDNEEELYMKLKKLCNEKVSNRTNYKKLVEKYDWSNMIIKYDQYFEQFKKTL